MPFERVPLGLACLLKVLANSFHAAACTCLSLVPLDSNFYLISTVPCHFVVGSASYGSHFLLYPPSTVRIPKATAGLRRLGMPGIDNTELDAAYQQTSIFISIILKMKHEEIVGVHFSYQILTKLIVR